MPVYMFNHPQYHMFANTDRRDHGPLIRYNTYVMWMYYKHNVQEHYRCKAYNKMLNLIPVSRIYNPKKLAHLTGYRTIHNTLCVMLSRSNLKMLLDMGIPTPDLSDEHFDYKENSKLIMKRLCYNHQHINKNDLYVDICNMWKYVFPNKVTEPVCFSLEYGLEWNPKCFILINYMIVVLCVLFIIEIINYLT